MKSNKISFSAQMESLCLVVLDFCIILNQTEVEHYEHIPLVTKASPGQHNIEQLQVWLLFLDFRLVLYRKIFKGSWLWLL